MFSHLVSLILVGLLDKFTYDPFSAKQVDWISDMLNKKYKYKTTKVMIIFKWPLNLLCLKPKDCIGLILCKEIRYLFKKRICCLILDHVIKSIAYAGTLFFLNIQSFQLLKYELEFRKSKCKRFSDITFMINCCSAYWII